MKKKIAFRDNSFDYFRMFSAILIIVGHSCMHLSIDIPVVINYILNSWVGLFCLFVLTGYLVPSSFERSENCRQYIVKRITRLYPALYLALLVSLICVIIIGRGYGISYRFFDIIKWIVAQISVFQFYTPSSLEAYGVGNPNGALWTISMEIQIYVIIMLFWNKLKGVSDIAWGILILSFVLINAVFGGTINMIPNVIGKLINVTFIPYMYVFLIGMYCYVKRDSLIPKLANSFYIILATYVIWMFANNFVIHFQVGYYTNIVSGIMIVLLTLSGGYRFSEHHVTNEVSFGLYIYHMIVINAFYMFGWIGKWWDIIGVLAISYGLAMISKYAIEEPFTRMIRGKSSC